MSRLFEPIQFRDLKIRNRVWMSPMCQYSAIDGLVQSWHLAHLGARAAGGVGLVMVEATGVSPEGRISPGCTGIWNEKHVEGFKKITDFVKSQGAVIGIQLAHAGRKASVDLAWKGGKPLATGEGGWPVIGPSAVAFKEGYQVPREMSEQEIEIMTEKFVIAADRALMAGFQTVELHMAHGYLMHEFLSPLSNFRQDKYGGSLENRMRFPLMVARAVRDYWPQNKPVFARISASDWVDGGWDLASSIVFCKELKKVGIDLIDVSSGGLSPLQKITEGPGYQVPFAEAIRREAGIAVGAVGLITEAKQCEEILASGKADVVLLARELLRNPYFALHAAQELGAQVPCPPQYLRSL